MAGLPPLQRPVLPWSELCVPCHFGVSSPDDFQGSHKESVGLNVQERQWVHGAWAKLRGGEELPVQLVYERVSSGLIGSGEKGFLDHKPTWPRRRHHIRS